MLVSQNYFLMGFEGLGDIKFELSPWGARLCHFLKRQHIKGAMQLWQFSNNWITRSGYRNGDRVGRYLITDGDTSTKVVIDAWDEGYIVDERSLKWADIYFKNNKWPSLDYPDKVFPLIHGNGRLNNEKLKYLKGLRNHPKENDLVYMSIMWSRPDNRYQNYHAIFEHHTRTFETLAAINCRSYLLAVIPRIYPEKDILPYLRRLDKAGVPWQRDWGTVSSKVLFDELAKAEVVYLRPGNALCISWRMIDLMAMGACVAYDGQPFPNWPQPLESGVHYLDCGCRLGADFSTPGGETYAHMRQVLETLLESRDQIARMRENNISYFERHAAPDKVATYLLETVRAFSKKKKPLPSSRPQTLSNSWHEVRNFKPRPNLSYNERSNSS
jgi:hypothetical protein